MKRWPVKPLGELAELIGGSTPSRTDATFWGGDIHWVTPTDLPKPEEGVAVVRKTKERITQSGLDNSSATIVPAGTVLFSSRATIGKVAVAAMPLTTNQGFANFIPKQEISSRFLAYTLWNERENIAALSGSTTFKEVTRSTLRNYKIAVPPLAEQERIVKLLDEADALRKLRAQADHRTAALLPALFDELFGDPATNPKSWPKRRLRDISSKFSDGPFGSNLKSSHYTNEGVRVIRLNNVGVGELLDDNKAYVSPQHFASLKKHECLPGDVLVGTLGSPNLRACIQPPEITQALNKSDCVQIRPNRELATSEFICGLLNLPSTLEMASGMIMGQTRARISMGRLAELVVPVPPLPLQQTFAWRVAEIRELEAAQAASRRRLDALFESLLHRAFAGELSPQDSSEIGLQHPKSVPASARPATQAQAYLIRLIPALLREVGHPLSLERLNSAVAFLFLPSDQLLPLVGRLSGPAAGVHFASFAQPYEDGAFLAAIKTLFRTQTLSSDTNRHGVLTLALTGKLPPLTSEIEADAHHLAPLVALIPPETVAPTLVRLQPARVREAVLMPA